MQARCNTTKIFPHPLKGTNLKYFFNSFSALSDKKYVPETCCLFDEYRGKYSNLPICQQWKLGPPTNPTTGMRNHHLYYKVSIMYCQN